MRARAAWLAVAIALGAGGAAADPKPTAVDIKPLRGRLLVLQDARGGTYVLVPGPDGPVYYGTDGTLYEQLVQSGGADGSAGTWQVGVWAPRVPVMRPGVIARRANGTYHRYCGMDDANDIELTERTGDRAHQVLDHSRFLTTASVRVPRLLARDDDGVYYYVDMIRAVYGGRGFRLLVGRKGALKPLPLRDLNSDSAGDVFLTSSGQLRLVHDPDSGRDTATWVHGDHHTALVVLDPGPNSPLIYRDLGVYSSTGMLCEDL
jgi:hypothetical protein